MTERISRTQTRWILLAVTVLDLAVAVTCYGYLITSNCGASGAHEFFSAVRAFHSQVGC